MQSIKLNIITIPNNIKKKLVYDPPKIITPFHKNKIKVLFADITASGRPSPYVEKYIEKNILPYYSNTHSNAYCGIMMKNLISKSKKIIREWLNIDSDKKIIFTGNGSTHAVTHLIYCLKINKHDDINIILSPFEHHSNYLPWIEISKKYPNIRINVIRLKNKLELDYDHIDELINKSSINTINIITIMACSNVLGTRVDTIKIYEMLNKNIDICDNYRFGKKNLLFVDYACSAPYSTIEGKYCDALFFSPHKFLGGPGSPGVLIANKSLFQNREPFIPGGGCVKKVDSRTIEYDQDIEKKETAGTPNIIGIIKIGKIIELQKKMIHVIKHNEKIISQYIFQKLHHMSSKFKQLVVIYPYLNNHDRLPIACIAIKNYHYNLLVVLLNDLFGIQTRGGISCTALLAEIIEKDYKISGWCRITFNWLMSEDDIKYIFSAIKYIILNIDILSTYYMYDSGSNLFLYKNKTLKCITKKIMY